MPVIPTTSEVAMEEDLGSKPAQQKIRETLAPQQTSWEWWHMSRIPPTQEAWVGGLQFKTSLGKKCEAVFEK
jgi:hypothetical protein